MSMPRIESFPKVADFMDTRPIALGPDDDILDAVDHLLRHGVTGAAVIDAERRPLGVIGERDCLKVLTQHEGWVLSHGRVRDYMRSEYQQLSPEMDIFYVAGLFLNERNWSSRRFLVVEDDQLVGVLTRFDVLRAVELVRQRRREMES